MDAMLARKTICLGAKLVARRAGFQVVRRTKMSTTKNAFADAVAEFYEVFKYASAISVGSARQPFE
jgi:hypothetical protein